MVCDWVYEGGEAMRSDHEIITLLQKRDEQGIGLLREQYGSLCHALAYRILGRQEDAEECVSDAMLMIWNSIPPDVPENLQAYLVTIVRRSAIDRLRRDISQKRGGAYYAQSLDELADVLPSADSVDAAVDQRELSRALLSFLMTLKPETRHIMMQRYYFAMPLQEIADINKLSLSKVKLTLMRTRAKLLDYLEKEGFQ